MNRTMKFTSEQNKAALAWAAATAQARVEQWESPVNKVAEHAKVLREMLEAPEEDPQLSLIHI